MRTDSSSAPPRPNILLVMADEYRFPRYFQPDATDPENVPGMREPIKNILGFQGDAEDIADYAKYFPGFVRLRENAVVLRNHTIAASACVPSRAAMFTGQYGARTGVTQTDGIFKSGDANNYPWLQPDGIPTMGDWFRAAGYQTHYFGKCHFADPPEHSLERFGFDDWEMSYPEPHGASPNNLGLYRDFGFTDLVTTFLRSKGLALGYDREQAELGEADPESTSGSWDQKRRNAEQQPWFAVASFTNPHDITVYPALTSKIVPGPKPGEPQPIPGENCRSKPPEGGTWKVNLNPDGFPQDNANLPPTWNEPIYKNNKPDCQYDYSLKLGIALASKGGSIPKTMLAPKAIGQPLPLSDDPKKWSTAYLQYYTYLHYALDQHIDAILKTLEETGLRENTIVVFAPDHGDYGAAHGMLQQKWHSAYQEAIHVPVVISSPQIKKRSQPIRQVDDLTSHIDLVPTLLGLAGIDSKARAELAEQLRVEHDVPELVGFDLSGIITGKKSKGLGREGILFVTDDMITEPLPYIDDPHNAENEDHFEQYCKAVQRFAKKWPERLPIDVKGWQNPPPPPPKPGPVCQPCHVQCVRQKDWKLVRYFDANDASAPEQWELYNLKLDPIEAVNLLVYDGEFPAPISDPPGPLTRKKIKDQAEALRELLGELTEKMLGSGRYPGEPPKCVGTDGD